MTDQIRVGDPVQVYFDAKFGMKEGWYKGKVFRIDPYSDHRSFYWVELAPEARAILQIREISVFNPKNIQKLDHENGSPAQM
jgi:hypothetical protein